MKWYDEHIEEPIRQMVKLLRDNGFNTTCSCGHKMYVEGIINIDGDIQIMHKLLYDYCCENKIEPNYKIDICVRVEKGYIVQKNFYIQLQ